MFTRRSLLKPAIAGLLCIMTAAMAVSAPATTSVEDVDLTTIEGSINAGGSITNPFIINYKITVTRRTGSLSTDKPGETYKTHRACIAFSSQAFNDSGCTSKVKLKQGTDLASSVGSFTAKMRQAGAKVQVSFSVKGVGTAYDRQPEPSYTVDPSGPDARADVGRWTTRNAKPKGTVLWPGYPRFAISGDASLERGQVTSAAVAPTS